VGVLFGVCSRDEVKLISNLKIEKWDVSEAGA